MNNILGSYPTILEKIETITGNHFRPMKGKSEEVAHNYYCRGRGALYK